MKKCKKKWKKHMVQGKKIKESNIGIIQTQKERSENVTVILEKMSKISKRFYASDSRSTVNLKQENSK